MSIHFSVQNQTEYSYCIDRAKKVALASMSFVYVAMSNTGIIVTRHKPLIALATIDRKGEVVNSLVK